MMTAFSDKLPVSEPSLRSVSQFQTLLTEHRTEEHHEDWVGYK